MTIGVGGSGLFLGPIYGCRANAIMRGRPYPLQRGYCTSAGATRIEASEAVADLLTFRQFADVEEHIIASAIWSYEAIARAIPELDYAVENVFALHCYFISIVLGLFRLKSSKSSGSTSSCSRRSSAYSRHMSPIVRGLPHLPNNFLRRLVARQDQAILRATPSRGT